MLPRMDGGRRRRLWGSVGRDLCDAGKKALCALDEWPGIEEPSPLPSTSNEAFPGTWTQGESFLLGNTGLLYPGEVGSPRDKKGSQVLKPESRMPMAWTVSATGLSTDALLPRGINSQGAEAGKRGDTNSIEDEAYEQYADFCLGPLNESIGGRADGTALDTWLGQEKSVEAEEGGKSQRVEWNWADMPMDILALVIAHLPVEERLLTAPLVCRGWHEAARLSSCFSEVDVDEWSQSFTMYATLDFFEGPQKLGRRVQDGLVQRVAPLGGASLQALRARQCTGAALAAIGQHCPQLRRLEMPDLRGPFDEALQPVIGRLEQLETLALQPLLVQQAEDCPVLSNATLEAMARSCRHLRQLDLTECRGLQRGGLLAVAQNCRQLQSLNLDSCLMGAEAAAVLEGLAAHTPGLTRLNMADCGLEGEGLAPLAALSQLRDLTLRCNYFPHTLPRVVGGLKQLRQLDVGDNPWLDDHDLDAIARGCPQLALLDVSNCAITDHGLSSLGRHCRGLRELHADYDMVTDAGLRLLAAGCSALRLLSLKNTGLTDAALAILAGAAPALTRLTVAGHRTRARSNGLTRDALARLVASCPNICGLGLSLVDLGPAAVEPPPLLLDASNSRGQPLPSSPQRGPAPGILQPTRGSDLGLSLPEPSALPPPWSEGQVAPAVPAQSPAALLQGGGEGPGEESPVVRHAGGMLATLAPWGRSLVDVRLDGPDREMFVDLHEALVEFVRCCPRLRMLDLNYFRNLTDATAGAVVALCPGLEQLGFGWCDLLSNEALVVVAASCRRLRILEICCCPRITGEAFEAIARTRPGVQVLSGHSVVFRVLRDLEGALRD